LSSGVFSFDQEQRLHVSNSAASDILNLPHAKLIGKTAAELAKNHPHIEKFMRAIIAGLNSARNEWQDEVTILGTHGRQILIMRGTLISTGLADNATVSSDSGSDNSYVVVFDDVTNLIQAQRDAAWGEVARRLAHEIKNPLTPIQLSAERIHNKFAHQLDEEMRETLERSTRTIVQQVEAMKEMVNAFSSYAQPVRATLKKLDVNQLIREVVELHASSLSDIEVELDLDPELPQIKANSTALRQVLNNLVINACHALENRESPQLQICTAIAPEVTGKYIDIVVADNGAGIPADIRDSLFDPYVSSKAKGSGLGLAIVKRIVEEHSGSVWSSNSDLKDPEGNTGAALHLRLPINAMQTYRGNRNQNTLHSAQG
jgi:nitrogen fixation/metabolism regulation signal transduction histidine kinase